MAATLLSIRTLARVRADQDASTFPTDAQYLTLINTSAQEVWYELLQAGWPLDFSSTTITANGAATYQVNSGNPVAGVRAVWYLQAGQFFELRRMNPGKEAQLRSTTSGFNYAMAYEVRLSPTQGTVVELFPPQTSGSYRVDFVPEFAGFVNDTDPWYGPSRTDELIALKAAMKAARKEGNTAQDLNAEYQELLQKVINQAGWLDMRNAPQIRDVSMTSPRSAFDYQVAGPGWSGDGSW